MKIWPNLIQRSEQWRAVRAGRPTASQFSRIITTSGQDSSAWESYAVALTAECLAPDPHEWTGNGDTDRGNELEPEARNLFAERVGMEVREVGFITRNDGIVGCSPDALVIGPNGRPVAGAEIKCPRRDKHALHLVKGELPSEHRQQVHGGMAVTGLKVWYYVSYCPGFPLLVVRVARDEFTSKVSDALDRFLIFYAERRKQLLPVLMGKEAA